MVIWDVGTAANYRCAAYFDLRVLDSGPTGNAERLFVGGDTYNGIFMIVIDIYKMTSELRKPPICLSSLKYVLTTVL